MAYERAPLGEVVDRNTYYDKTVEYGGEQELALHATIWSKVTREFERAGKSAESVWSNEDSHMLLEDGNALTYISVGPEEKVINSSVAVRDIRVYVNSPDFQGAIFLSIPFDEQGDVTQFPEMQSHKRVAYSGQPCYVVGSDLRIQLYGNGDVARIIPAKDWAGSEVNHTTVMRELTESATPESIVQEVLDHTKGATYHVESDFLGQSKTTLMRMALNEIYQNPRSVIIDSETGEVAVLTNPTRDQKGLSRDQCVATLLTQSDARTMMHRHWGVIWHPETFREFEELCERIRRDAVDI